MTKPRLLVVSHVCPVPATAGQRQRVYYTLTAARRRFHVTLALLAARTEQGSLEQRLAEICDELVVLPSRYSRSRLSRLWNRAAAINYGLRTGLKFSNYALGEVELSPRRVLSLLERRPFDCALFEYWHAWRAAAAVHARGVPTVVDTHNVLWQAYQRDLAIGSHAPLWWQRRAVREYRRREERAWSVFDALIAINRDEFGVISGRVPPSADVFYTPMGIDLDQWPYSWLPDAEVRLAYYGGLGSPHNQRDALSCAERVMPEIWRAFPAAELWLIGNNPPDKLRVLTSDRRIHVTGFVEKPQDVLRSMSVVLCPWSGTYGFRSRLVEVLALGVPVVASPDAIAGMDFVDGESISLATDAQAMACRSMQLVSDSRDARRQSELGRAAVEKHYNNDNTYGRLIDDLCLWLKSRKSASVSHVKQGCAEDALEPVPGA